MVKITNRRVGNCPCELKNGTRVWSQRLSRYLYFTGHKREKYIFFDIAGIRFDLSEAEVLKLVIK
jgi:hypothetical protein